MSAATAKKAQVTARGGTPEPTPSPARRGSAASVSSSSSSAPVRARSIRQSGSISARGAARQSPLSNGNVNVNGASGGGGDAAFHAEEDARAEAAAKLQDLQERLAAAEFDKAQFAKQADVLQSRLDDATHESARAEEKVHEAEEHLEALRLEKRESARQMREMEAIYEAERSSMNREKEEMANREEEMQAVIQRLKDSLAQRNHASNPEDEYRPSRSAAHSPILNGDGFAPPSALARSDSRNNSKLLLQKDKLIESLRLELAEAQIKLVESENQGGGRLQEVERLLMEARMANARLMEDNESYQLLLQEKTLAGDFGKSDFSYMGRGANQDALSALEGRSRSGSTSGAAAGSSSLADELSDAAEAEGESYRRLEAELKASKEQNKALTLYINKIIERLLQHQDFEHILDQSGDGAARSPTLPNTNKDLPPPPQPSGSTLLQRARMMATSAGAASSPRTRQAPSSSASSSASVASSVSSRPTSFAPSQGENSAHTDPERAPSIPIGNFTRSGSVRRTRPASEQFTASGAASLVSQMYHGGNGPASPPLGPPRAQTFFSPSGMAGNPNAAARHPSGHGHAHSNSGGGQSASGNFPGTRGSDASSTTSGDSAGDVGTVSSPGHSPPRAPSEKSTTTFFAGNKPRPLRLVQENEAIKAENEAIRAENNRRASWMPWSWGAAVKKEDISGEPIIRE